MGHELTVFVHPTLVTRKKTGILRASATPRCSLHMPTTPAVSNSKDAHRPPSLQTQDVY